MQQGPVAKKDVALFLLESSLVQFHIDPRKTGVALPDYLRKQPQVALDIGLNTPVPIPDLEVTEDGITCTLSFNRAPFFCILPWTAIFAMVTREGKAAVWPEDVPPESPLAKELKDPPKPRLSAVPTPPPDPPTRLDAEREKRAASGDKPAKKSVTKGRSKKADGRALSGDTAAAPEKLPKRAPKNARKAPIESPSVSTRPAVVPIARPMRLADAAAPPAKPTPAALPEKQLSLEAVLESNASTQASTTAEPIDEAALAATKPREKTKAKRELPPYLRVVK